MSELASIILAGGESRRMGEPKLLIKYQGKSLLAHAVEKALILSPYTTVVVGAYHNLYRTEALEHGANVIYARDWLEGQGASLRAGFRSLDPHITHCYILLADQPFVPVDHLKNLYSTALVEDAALVFSSYDSLDAGVQGPPALVHKSLFEAAKRLKPQQGAKALITQTKLATLSLAAWQDIDTPEDVRQFLS